MKRLRELFVATLAISIAFSFFGEYAVTASAPGIYDVKSESSGAFGVNSEKPRRVYTLPVPVGIPPAADLPAAKAVVADPAIPTEAAKSESIVAEPADQSSTVLGSSLLRNLPEAGFKTLEDFQPPVPDGNYCDPTFIGRDIVFTQTSQLTLDLNFPVL